MFLPDFRRYLIIYHNGEKVPNSDTLLKVYLKASAGDTISIWMRWMTTNDEYYFNPYHLNGDLEICFEFVYQLNLTID